MPTYEYECVKCGAVFELIQPITEPARRRLRKDDPKPCSCKGDVKRRIGTGAGIIFKGSGFYQTDYRSDSYKKAAKAEKEAAEGKSDKGKKGDKAEKSTKVETKKTKADSDK